MVCELYLDKAVEKERVVRVYKTRPLYLINFKTLIGIVPTDFWSVLINIYSKTCIPFYKVGI